MSDVSWNAIGRSIVDVRTASDKFEFGYNVVLVLDDGTEIFASQDVEGNGPGELFATLSNGDEIIIYVARVVKENV